VHWRSEFLRWDGFHVSVSVGAANFPGSAPRGVACALDVSERKRIEVPLHTNKAKCRTLIDGVPPIVFMNGSSVSLTTTSGGSTPPA
jgi:hypothetical protein